MKNFIAISSLLVTAVSAQDCAWTQQTPVPAEVSGCAMAYDSQRRVAVLFAGLIGTGIEQTWEWNGIEWQLRAETGPDYRGGRALSYDSSRDLMVYYDGNTATWEWDGVIWTPRNDVGDIGMRDHFGMAFDEDRGVTVVFGGSEDGGELLADTWEYNGTLWKQVSLTGPSARYFTTMAYDPERAVTVLYGGAGSGESFSDTWEWGGESWSQVDANGPLGKRTRGAIVFDTNLRACVYFGGHKDNQVHNDAWAWDGQSWTLLDAPNAPTARMDHSMAYDTHRRAIVLFGGRSKGGQTFNDTWELVCSPPPCYPDLDGSGVLDLFDFLAFVNSFNAGEAGPADCDGNGELDFFDFLCFTNAFNAGC